MTPHLSMTKQFIYEQRHTGEYVVLNDARETIAVCPSKVWALAIIGLLNDAMRPVE